MDRIRLREVRARASGGERVTADVVMRLAAGARPAVDPLALSRDIADVIASLPLSRMYDAAEEVASLLLADDACAGADVTVRHAPSDGMSSEDMASDGMTDGAYGALSVAVSRGTSDGIASDGSDAGKGAVPVERRKGATGDEAEASDAAVAAVDDARDGRSDGLTSRGAVISMDSTSTDAERLFREAIVAVDSIPGNQVEGISPLYHVSNFDGPDAMCAVMRVVTRLSARELIGALGTVEAAHDGLVDLDLVDMDGVTSDEPDCRVPWPTAREHAGVLAPWLDMDPDARLGRDPVSFLLAMAPDAARVGLLSDAWILGAR